MKTTYLTHSVLTISSLFVGSALALCLALYPMSATAQQPADDTVEAAGDGEDTEDAEGQEEAQTSSSLQRGGRMEFDARVIRGERAGSGAVFLFQRPPRPLPSMIERRSSYLQGTVHRVFGDEGVQRLDQSREDQ